MSNSAFMTYYEHLSKLSTVANKQTLFLNHLLFYVEYDKETKQTVVEMTPRRKRAIMKEITPENSNPLASADQYLLKIGKAGLIKGVGRGLFLIDPKSFGFPKYMPKNIRNKAGAIYETRVFTETEGNKVVSSYLVDEKGVKHDL